MTHDAPLTLAHRFAALFDARDVDRAARTLFTADYQGTDLSLGRRTYDLQEAQHRWRRWMTAFPDVRLAVHEVVELADHLSVQWTLTGRHERPFLRVPATFRTVAVDGLSLFTLRDERLAAGTHLWDFAGMLRAMRLLPDLPAFAAPARTLSFGSPTSNPL